MSSDWEKYIKSYGGHETRNYFKKVQCVIKVFVKLSSSSEM